ncbi:MAG: cytochrome c [Hyphomicrobium sp.]|nr:cytochrome c [Hyphomicrobium sp.]
MFRAAVAAALLVLGTGVAFAQNADAIKQRKANFKAIADAVKPTGEMLKGEADFDLAAVKAAIAAIKDKAPQQPKLFPDDSKEGEKTEALPAIWENKADFEERFGKIAKDAEAADASITDAATFEEVWPTVVGQCGECHKKYRQKKQ